MKKIVLCALLGVMVFGVACASLPKSLGPARLPLTSLQIPLAVSQDSVFEGIPLLVTSQVQSGMMLEQEFILKAWAGKKYLGIVANGWLQPDGILWLEFTNGQFAAKAGQKYVFWAMPKDKDQIGVKEMIFLADEMFSWNGDDPKNPPE